ncbi:MAG: dihydrodipicolinate synthase family protein [Lentisphaeria bacterium]|nr:dihydrodipicolinate synthase family protein [Lentisphaeria bacterium]
MFQGVYAALLTPFGASGEVDEGLLREHVEWLIGKGIDGLYVCGNSGQGLYLSVSERMRVTEVVREQVAGRCAIMCHVATLATRDAWQLARHAQEAGADAVASLPPIYGNLSPRQVVGYYRDLMEGCGLPGFMYVLAGPGMAPLAVETVLEIAGIPGMVGMKYTDPDFFRMQDIRQRLDGRWTVFSGPDQLFLPALTMGVSGSIGTTQNVFPELFVEILRCFRAREWERAMRLQEVVTQVVRLYQPHGGVATAHAMLAVRGFPVSDCRPPQLRRLPEEAAGTLLSTLREIVAACPMEIEL